MSANSSPPSTSGPPNLVENQREVPETWYLDPAEWEQMRAEINFCRAMRERLYRPTNHLYVLQRKLRRCMTSLQTKTDTLRALARKSLTPDEMLEFRRFVSEWRKDAARIHTLIDRLTKQRHQSVASPSPPPASPDVHTLRDEMIALTEVARRLRKREALLLKAIGAGLYMTTTDIHALHQNGGLTNRQFMELLGIQIRVYEGRSGRRHA